MTSLKAAEQLANRVYLADQHMQNRVTDYQEKLAHIEQLRDQLDQATSKLEEIYTTIDASIDSVEPNHRFSLTVDRMVSFHHCSF